MLKYKEILWVITLLISNMVWAGNDGNDYVVITTTFSNSNHSAVSIANSNEYIVITSIGTNNTPNVKNDLVNTNNINLEL